MNRLPPCRHPLCAAGLALCASAASAGEPFLQFGFDYTSGSVQSCGGGLVLNDASSRFHGYPAHGNGGTYTADLPPRVRFATGQGSLDLATGSCSNDRATPTYRYDFCNGTTCRTTSPASPDGVTRRRS